MNVFSGKVTQTGLSNEKHLISRCPEKFKNASNVWTLCATKICEDGAAVSPSWKFTSKSMTERRKQMDYLNAIIKSERLSDKEKVSIVAWMLFEMLLEHPRDMI